MLSNTLKASPESRNTLSSIFANGENYNIIDYTFDSMLRILSIALRNIKSGQQTLFSIHLEAEIKGINLDQIKNMDTEQIKNTLDSLEKSMLKKFFAYLKAHPEYHYVHWDMRNVIYGFQAIEQRFRVLRGKPYKVLDCHKHDLSMLLRSIYGRNYIDAPELENLIKENNIETKDLLQPAEEELAFIKNQFLKIHKSTLRKTDILADIAQLAHEDKLKTHVTWKDSLSDKGWFIAIIRSLKAIIFIIIGGFISPLIRLIRFLSDIAGASDFVARFFP